MPSISVIIVEDQTTFREMLAELLRADDRYTVAAQLGHGQAGLAAIERYRPQMAIIDVVLPDMNGLDVVRHIRKHHPNIRVVVVTAHTKAQVINEAYHAQAHGVISKNTSLFHLRDGLNKVASGEQYFCPTTHALLERQAANPLPNDLLSARERQVIQLVAQGKSSRSIAEELSLSPKTVANHRHRISKKLGIHDVAGLTRYALARGWVDDDGP